MNRQERKLIRAERKKQRRNNQRGNNQRSTLGGFAILGRIFTIGGSLVLVAIVAASYFTPLLAIEEIKVVGLERLSESEVRRSLQPLMQRPLPSVTEAEITELLSEHPLIETFAVRTEPPHTLTLRVRERQPIVIMPVGGTNYLFDPAGVRIAEASLEDPYPFFLLAEDPATSERFATAIDVLLELPLETYSQIFAIEVSSRQTTEFRLRGDNLRVIWGGPDNALLKAEVLESLLATQERTDITIDVSSPATPVITFSDF
jgi:cell division protein FtsQ